MSATSSTSRGSGRHSSKPWSSKIGPGPRPWTDAGLAAVLGRSPRRSGRPVYYADSAARGQLARALERYVRREVTGSSYLLAADRGSGKTTTVEWVVQSLYAECLADDSSYLGHRPLLVRLYGPNLAPVRDPPPEGAREDIAAHSRYPPVLQLLRDMAVSLFESVLSEIERTIRLRVERASGPALATREDDLELFLQLRHEMRRGPTVADLMAYWERLGWGKRGAFSREATHRGAAEVAVLQDLAEARLAVVSKVEDKRGGSDAVEAERERKSTVQPADLLKTSTAVIAGAAVAGGLALEGSWITAGILGPLITAGVGASLTFSSRFARRQSQQDEREYVLKADVESLIHRLPRLLQGLRQVGLHPVFVVDELDKVDPELVTYLVNNLKTQVTEQSFFCFLTNHEGAATSEEHDEGASVGSSLFWDRLYLFQTTAALHGYLQTFLAEQEAEEGMQREAVAVVRHILLLRAEHHTLRLHRELEQALREGLYARIDDDPEGFLQDSAIRLRLRFALVTEWAMAELAAETCNDPRRLQLAKEVLYRPWRSWRGNEERCGLTRLDVYREVREATGDRDFAGHVARALDTLLEQLAALSWSCATAPDDARTRAYLGVQCPPAGLASTSPSEDALKRTVEAHAHQGPLLDRESHKWLERPAIVQELDIEHRLQQLATVPCVEQVGGLPAVIEVLFSEPSPSSASIVQRESDVLSVAFLARALAASFQQTHAEALEAVGLLAHGTVRIPRETVERLGRHLQLEDLDDLVEAADAATLEARLKSRGPLTARVGPLRQAWLDDWLLRFTQPWEPDDRGSVLDPLAELKKWPRGTLWRWRMHAHSEPGPERSVALWSELVQEAYARQLPQIFGVLALHRLGFSLRSDAIEEALQAHEGQDAVKRQLAELLQSRRPLVSRSLVLETGPDGAGEGWALDEEVPALLLDTDRNDAAAILEWITARLQGPEPHAPSRAVPLRFGRMDLRRISPPEGVVAYVLGPGQLRPAKAPPGKVLCDPGSPRGLLDAYEQVGSSGV
ncbi:hypothetical protein [Paraliomyxa miuraensis]|uniref:hypothetical protein n=1 Tax=Paraliomyxa miuraensis TaxID=376150 RepID=UPI00225B475A|nr:hypothetical protein [Paraliomyxa miuraensis]MCX4247854.1 hypothetical protein [Paraliomyxa miuraensis]